MLILLTGGSACGKSSYGEKLAVLGPKPLYYIAAMQPYDDECLKKIARHRELRKDKGFLTIEQYTGVDTLELPETGGTALLECLCNLTANEMYIQPDDPTDPVEKVVAGVKNLQRQTDTLIRIPSSSSPTTWAVTTRNTPTRPADTSAPWGSSTSEWRRWRIGSMSWWRASPSA